MVICENFGKELLLYIKAHMGLLWFETYLIPTYDYFLPYQIEECGRHWD